MTVLSDRDIKRSHATHAISITPWNPDRVQPASYDVALSSNFRIFNKSDRSKRELPPAIWAVKPMIDTGTGGNALDPTNLPSDFTTLLDTKGEPFLLRPNEFVLGMTYESVRCSDSICARIEGKSSLGRLGLIVHSTAGYIDPGFEGNVTLEIANLSPFVIVLKPGMLIAQVCFMRLSMSAEKPYGHKDLKSKYQGATEPQESRYERES